MQWPGYTCSTGLKAKCYMQHSVAQHRPAATQASCGVTPCAAAASLASLQYAAGWMGQPALFLPAAREGCISQLSGDCCACRWAVDLIICGDSSAC